MGRRESGRAICDLAGGVLAALIKSGFPLGVSAGGPWLQVMDEDFASMNMVSTIRAFTR